VLFGTRRAKSLKTISPLHPNARYMAIAIRPKRCGTQSFSVTPMSAAAQIAVIIIEPVAVPASKARNGVYDPAIKRNIEA